MAGGTPALPVYDLNDYPWVLRLEHCPKRAFTSSNARICLTTWLQELHISHNYWPKALEASPFFLPTGGMVMACLGKLI
jgi:hypothetical protein